MKPLIEIFDLPFSFTRRPSSFPAELRPTWRIALVILILFNSRSKRASLNKVHVTNWAIRSEKNRDAFLRCIRGETKKESLVPRIEPSLNRAIEYARAEGLIVVSGGRTLQLTTKGLCAAQEIVEDNYCMAVEKRFINDIKSAFSESSISQFLSWELPL